MGFCVFNNVAISAKYLINRYGLENIAIIDFDVHHGNGTQDIFYENSKVHYYSTHQYPLYPGTGDTNEKGVGNIVNVPLQAGTNSSQYQLAFDEMIIKKLHDQKPDFLILSAGFDAHEKDPLASLELLENDFKLITQKLMSIADKYCDNRIISMLEGGYDIQALENSMITHIRELQNND
jgi:acetoin utilization deacetylase AcuC-like enzyme